MDHSGGTSMTDEALDRQLDAAFAVEPSPEFMARIRSRVASESTRPRWRFGWSPVAWSAGGLSLAAGVVVVALFRGPSGNVTQSPGDHAATTPAVLEVDTMRAEPPGSDGMSGSAPAPVPRRARIVSRSLPTTVSPASEPGIVIAADEAAALRDLFGNRNKGRLSASTMLPEVSAAPAPLPPIELIDVPPISMNPLRPIEALGAL